MQFFSGVLEVGDEGFFQGFVVNALWPDARQAVDLGIAQHLGVGDRQLDPGTEFFDPVRVARQAAFALGPVTGRQVEQHLGQAVGVELCLDFGRAEFIREQVLDPLEAGIGGRFETGKEVLFGKQHGQVGGETRHKVLLNRAGKWQSAHRCRPGPDLRIR